MHKSMDADQIAHNSRNEARKGLLFLLSCAYFFASGADSMFDVLFFQPSILLYGLESTVPTRCGNLLYNALNMCSPKRGRRVRRAVAEKLRGQNNKGHGEISCNRHFSRASQGQGVLHRCRAREDKVPAILGALRGRFINIFITGEETARALLNMHRKVHKPRPGNG